MREAFIEHNFSKSSLGMITLVNSILEEYRRQGFRLSLRQLYYQLVARDHIPNSQRSYKNLGALVSNARQAGYIDWEMIEDRNRETVINAHWDNPGQIVDTAARFGESSWELDAIEPRQLADLVIQAVLERRNIDLWDAAVKRENQMRAELRTFADTYRSE